MQTICWSPRDPKPAFNAFSYLPSPPPQKPRKAMPQGFISPANANLDALEGHVVLIGDKEVTVEKQIGMRLRAGGAWKTVKDVEGVFVSTSIEEKLHRAAHRAKNHLARAAKLADMDVVGKEFIYQNQKMECIKVSGDRLRLAGDTCAFWVRLEDVEDLVDDDDDENNNEVPVQEDVPEKDFVPVLTVVDRDGNYRASFSPDGEVRNNKDELLGYIEGLQAGSQDLDFLGEVLPLVQGEADVVVADATGEWCAMVDLGNATLRDWQGNLVAEITGTGEVKGSSGLFLGSFDGFDFSQLKLVALYLAILDPGMLTQSP